MTDSSRDSTPRFSGAGALLTLFACASVACGDAPKPVLDPSICGDGIRQAAEACDDGATEDGDGCSPACSLEPGFECREDLFRCAPVCGDGLRVAGELCDDGNVTGGDGCSSSCAVTPGYICDAVGPGACRAVCGDGLVVGAERCDDGGQRDGDGCGAECVGESGWACAEGTSCTPLCGDGITLGEEACDDGNTEPGDGCSPKCVATELWRPIPLPVGLSGRADGSLVWTGTQAIIWGGSAPSPSRDGALFNPSTNAWNSVALQGAPSVRTFHTAVWSGREMLVFGGIYGELGTRRGVGGRYEPGENAWAPMSEVGAPAPRCYHNAVWTGEAMIVFGGLGQREVGPGTLEDFALGDGAAYDPATDRWSPLPAEGAPAPRLKASMVWTGQEVIIFGGRTANGQLLGDGARYNPTTRTWRPLALEDAPSPRADHAAIWTGEEMIVVGGRPTQLGARFGARYAVTTDTWTPLPSSGEPTRRQSTQVAWTGSELLIFGGTASAQGRPFGDGAAYLPAIDAWAPLPAEGAPAARDSGLATWTGSQFFVWGGRSGRSDADEYWADGALFDPATRIWTRVVTPEPLTELYLPLAVWTGSDMLVFGERLSAEPRSQVAKYSPSRGTWVLREGLSVPEVSVFGSWVWTGTEAITWGGRGLADDLNRGARYRPDEDAWVPTSTAGAPSARNAHSSVWTGSEMLVFGGISNRVLRSDGAGYDPSTNSWRPLAPVAATEGRSFHASVWTGGEMLLWGGSLTGGSWCVRGDGLSYDPTLDTWTRLPDLGAPSPRTQPSAVWTGKEMILWGGVNQEYAGDCASPFGPDAGQGEGHAFGDGAAYDPITRTWRPLSNANAPSPRRRHTAVWNGKEMIVWGGDANFTNASLEPLGDGARYDPDTDTWTPLTAVDAPSPRLYHVGVWADSSMIIWGGLGPGTGTAYNDGAHLRF